MLVAVSYSILIPFTVWKIYERLKLVKKFPFFNLQNFFVVIFIIFWLFTIRQAVMEQLPQNFKTAAVPSEYVTFEQALVSQSQFSRVLWLPQVQRLGYYSLNHPEISAQDLFAVYNEPELIKKLKQPGIEKLLQEIGVKYVVIPTDSQKEIFLKNRSYSKELYLQTINDISAISWLHRATQFTTLVVFEVPHPKDHFWSSTPSLRINYQMKNPTQYRVIVSNAKKGDKLVFSESFDKNWTAQVVNSNSIISSSKYDKFLNSFILPQNGNYTLVVYYPPQKWVDRGFGVSLVTVFILAGSLFVFKKRAKGEKS